MQDTALLLDLRAELRLLRPVAVAAPALAAATLAPAAASVRVAAAAALAAAVTLALAEPSIGWVRGRGPRVLPA